MIKPLSIQPRRLDLDFMRGIAIIAVIVIHCIAPIVTTHEVGSTSWIIGNVIDSAARWAVPLFVIISGGLLIKRSTYTDISQFYKKRLRRLFLPLIAWPVIYYLWYIITVKSTGLSDFIEAYLVGKPLGGYHLYFLFLITGLYVAAPILSAFVSRVSKKQVWVMCIMILATTTLSLHLNQFLRLPVSYNVFNYFLPYIGYFLLGYLLIDLKVRPSTKLIFSVIVTVSMVATIAILSYLTKTHLLGLPFYEYTSLPVVTLSVSIFFLLQVIADNLEKTPDSVIKIFRSLSSSSLGIYLIHLIFLQGTIQILKLNKASVITALMLVPFVLALSWITVLIFRRTKLLRPFVE